MQRKIITYPNKNLFLKSRPVENFDEQLHALLDDMYETMLAHSGVGLAAIQINLPLQVCIVNIPDENEEQKKEDLLEIINPKIKILGEELIIFREGCLSVPDFFEEVERPDRILLTYQDRFGQSHELEADGFLSVAIQHEFDHLQGRLFIEKLSFSQRQLFEKEYKKKQKEAKKNSKKPQAKNDKKTGEKNPKKSPKTPTKKSNTKAKKSSPKNKQK